MRIRFVKQLIELMKKNNIKELEIRSFGKKIRISKTFEGEVQEKGASITKGVETEPEKTIEFKEPPKVEEKEDNLHTITSPMVGTFYRAPAPDAPPYVENGDHIKRGDVVCIIEAMKIMNEIESDISGEIVEVLVANEDPVEYNQGLFVIRKT